MPQNNKQNRAQINRRNARQTQIDGRRNYTYEQSNSSSSYNETPRQNTNFKKRKIFSRSPSNQNNQNNQSFQKKFRNSSTSKNSIDSRT